MYFSPPFISPFSIMEIIMLLQILMTAMERILNSRKSDSVTEGLPIFSPVFPALTFDAASVVIKPLMILNSFNDSAKRIGQISATSMPIKIM